MPLFHSANPPQGQGRRQDEASPRDEHNPEAPPVTGGGLGGAEAEKYCALHLSVGEELWRRLASPGLWARLHHPDSPDDLTPRMDEGDLGSSASPSSQSSVAVPASPSSFSSEGDGIPGPPGPALPHVLLSALAALVYRYDPTRTELAVACVYAEQGKAAAAAAAARAWSQETVIFEFGESKGEATALMSPDDAGAMGGGSLGAVPFAGREGAGGAAASATFRGLVQQCQAQQNLAALRSGPHMQHPCSPEEEGLKQQQQHHHQQQQQQTLASAQVAELGFAFEGYEGASPNSSFKEAESENVVIQAAGSPSLILRVRQLPSTHDGALQAAFLYKNSEFSEEFLRQFSAHYCSLLEAFSSPGPLDSSGSSSSCISCGLSSSDSSLDGLLHLPPVQGVGSTGKQRLGLSCCGLFHGALDAPLHAVPMLSDAERLLLEAQLSGRGIARAQGPEGDEVLTDMVDRQAQERPHALAVQDDEQSLTYAELRARARALAYYLLSLEKPCSEDRSPRTPRAVGLGMERSAEWVVSLLGVLYAGMAYVPLDPAFPSTRLQKIVEAAELRTVLTTAGSQGRFSWLGAVLTGQERLPVRVVRTGEIPGRGCNSLEEGEEEDPKVSTCLQKSRARGSDPCYILFTSGSTGEPKGVVVLHQGVRNMCHAFRETLVGDAPDVRAQLAAMTFDLHAMEIFLAMDTGAALAVCRKEELLTDLGGFMRRRGVRGVVLTPTVCSLLDPSSVPSLQWLALGGEILPRSLLKRWTDAGRTVVDHYGPTEVSIAATGQTWRPGDHVADHIGGPLPGAHVYVLGPHQELLPVGVPGEICIAGVHVSWGYLKRPDLTARAYLPNPYSAGEHDRVLYRTGDRGRWLPSGRLQFLGRVDFQIKLRGMRIEPGEIEGHISRVPGVARCVVVLRQDAHRGPFLAAYLMPRAGALAQFWSEDGEGRALKGRVRQALEARLPEYMVPAAFVLLKRLPQTSSGKVDRKQLPEPAHEDFLMPSKGGRLSPQGSPHGDGEKAHRPEVGRVQGLFAEVLGVGPGLVGLEQSFFLLGGNSLLASQLLGKLHQAFGDQARGLSIRSFFQRPTVLDTAQQLVLHSSQGEQEVLLETPGPECGAVEHSVAAAAAPIDRSSPECTRFPAAATAEDLLRHDEQERRELVPQRATCRGRKRSPLKLPRLVWAAQNWFKQVSSMQPQENRGTSREKKGFAQPKEFRKGESAPPAGATVLGPGGRSRVLPLSHAQEMIWLVQHVLPQPEALDVTDVWRVHGEVDVGRLEHALAVLVRRHQALRLSFTAEKGSPAARLMSLMLDRWGPKGSTSVPRGGSSSSTYARRSNRRHHGGVGVGAASGGDEPQEGRTNLGNRFPAPDLPGAVASSFMGLVGRAFLRNLHFIFRAVKQYDQDWDKVPLSVEEVDLRNRVHSSSSRAELDSEVHREVSRACRPFETKQAGVGRAWGRRLKGGSLSKGGDGKGFLFRVTLIRTGEGEALLVCVFSHLILDGMSAAVFYRELQHVYKEGSAAGLPQALSYGEFVAWEEAHLQAGARERELAFWRERLGRDPPPMRLGMQRSVASIQSCQGHRARGRHALPFRAGCVEVEVPAALRKRLDVVAHERGATLNMALLAAYHSMLHARTGRVRVITGILVGRRTRVEHHTMLGHCADLSPVVTDLGDVSSEGGFPVYPEVVDQVRERVVEVMENQSVTFRMIATEVLTRPDLTKDALVQAYYNFLQPGVNCSPEELSLETHGEPLLACSADFDYAWSWAREGTAALTPLCLTLRVRQDGSIKGRFVFQADVIDAESAEGMADDWRCILEHAIETVH